MGRTRSVLGPNASTKDLLKEARFWLDAAPTPEEQLYWGKRIGYLANRPLSTKITMTPERLQTLLNQCDHYLEFGRKQRKQYWRQRKWYLLNRRDILAKQKQVRERRLANE